MSRSLLSTVGLAALLSQLLAGCPGRVALTQTPVSLFAYITQFNTNEVAVVDAVLKTPTGTPIKVGAGPVKMALKPTGSQEYLYVLNQTGSTVSFVNRRSGSTEEEVAAGTNPDDIAISPDGKWLFVTSPGAGTVTRLNVTSRIADQTLTLGSGFKPRGIVVNPACQKAANGDCAALTIYVVNEAVTTQTGSAGNVTKTGQVRVLTSQSSGLVDGPTIQLNGAERPLRATIDQAGKNLFITDTELGSGMWRIDTGSSAAILFGQSPVGQTHDVEVANDGTVYATIPRKNQYVQIKPEGSALLFPDQTKIRDTQPEAIAFNHDQSELWIGFIGTSTVAYATVQTGGRLFDLRAVAFSLSSQTKQPPRDIVLAGGAGN
ncbi:MAG: YncE family protein [Candidatus Sericytochromatia bacterium]|nr:YncE family protein [Candidatus Tanganyikabacteria bacterium]